MNLTREFLQTVVNTSNATSKDKTRYDLGSVYVQFTDKDAIVVATNGHILSETLVKEAGIVEDLKELSFDKDDVANVKALLRKNKYVNDFELKKMVHGVNGSEVLFLSCSSSGFQLANNKINFPDYNDVIKFVPQGPVKVLQLNANLLMALAESLGKEERASSYSITLVIGPDAITPIAVFRGDGNTGHIQRAVIMPMTSDGTEALIARLGVQTYEMIEEAKNLEAMNGSPKAKKQISK